MPGDVSCSETSQVSFHDLRAKHVFKSANVLAVSLQHSQIEPLHLLATILEDDSSEGAKLVQSLGITKKNVLSALNYEDRGRN